MNKTPAQQISSSLIQLIRGMSVEYDQRKKMLGFLGKIDQAPEDEVAAFSDELSSAMEREIELFELQAMNDPDPKMLELAVQMKQLTNKLHLAMLAGKI